MTGAEAGIPRSFAGAEIGDRRNQVCPGGFVRPVSNAEFPISGIPRRAGESGLLFLETDCIRAVTTARVVQANPSCFSWSAQTIGRLRARRVTVSSAGARPSAIASMMRGER